MVAVHVKEKWVRERFILQGKVAALNTWGGVSLYFRFHVTFLMLLGRNCDNVF